MNTEHTNQSSQAEPVNQQLLALVKSFGHKTGCAKNAFGELCTCGVDEAIAAAEQAQQAEHAVRLRIQQVKDELARLQKGGAR